MDCETLIVSDVHLGSAVSLAAALTHLLKNSKFNRLILLGDIFQDLNFSRLTSEHWKLISYIRKLSNPKRGVEVVWVEGNHDAGITEVMEHLLGVKVYKEYTWESGGKKCLAIHGHQYDNLWAKGVPLLGRIFTPIYLGLQHIGFLKKWLPRLLDKLHTHWERLDVKVAQGAMKHAAHVSAEYVFCGHTHCPMHEFQDNISYWNTGDWTGEFGTYITVTGEKVELHEYRIDHSDSGEERGEVDSQSPTLAGVADVPGL
jgi:UDP-2,3-diacylglucosamine pyrophosphatase LpxH